MLWSACNTQQQISCSHVGCDLEANTKNAMGKFNICYCSVFRVAHKIHNSNSAFCVLRGAPTKYGTLRCKLYLLFRFEKLKKDYLLLLISSFASLFVSLSVPYLISHTFHLVFLHFFSVLILYVIFLINK